MPRMNYYTPENPPKSGNARKIWRALTSAGFTIHELHYNPNLWGRGQDNGWGTWAFRADSVPIGFSVELIRIGAYAGVFNGRVYVQNLSAPYNAIFVDQIDKGNRT